MFSWWRPTDGETRLGVCGHARPPALCSPWREQGSHAEWYAHEPRTTQREGAQQQQHTCTHRLSLLLTVRSSDRCV